MLPTGRYVQPPRAVASEKRAADARSGRNEMHGSGHASRGRGRGRGGSRGGARGGAADRSVRGKAARTAAPEEKYVVVIRNVENDLAKIHKSSLPFYCCLDPAADALAASAPHQTTKRSGCTYTLTCRSETRSGELCVYGPADADVASVFAASSASKRSKPSAARTAQAAETADHTEADDATQAELIEDTEGRQGASAASSSGRTHAFKSLEDMVAVLSTHPYFTHPPRFRLSVTGKEVGASLQSAALDNLLHRMREREAAKEDDDKDEEDAVEEREDAHTARKVARTEAGGASAGKSSDRAAVKKPLDVKKSVEVSAQALHQYGGRQEDLVTAVASISATQWSDKDVRRQFGDLPGFVNCWKLQKKRYRVVFENATSLFKAKQLLDQFELDGHVRVTVQLSDALGRRFTDFLNANEEVPVSDLALALNDDAL